MAENEAPPIDMYGERGGRLDISVFPRYDNALAPPRPFLVPSFDGEVVEILPSEKANRKIFFEESVHICEIENRCYYNEYMEEDQDGSYDIEIVDENDDDADFYLEIVDGEVFYVFETEDDISVEDDCSYETDEEESPIPSGPIQSVQLPIESMQIPDFDGGASIVHMNVDSVSAEIEKATQEDRENLSEDHDESEHPEIDVISIPVSPSQKSESSNDAPNQIPPNDNDSEEAQKIALQIEIAAIEAELEKAQRAAEAKNEQQIDAPKPLQQETVLPTPLPESSESVTLPEASAEEKETPTNSKEASSSLPEAPDSPQSPQATPVVSAVSPPPTETHSSFETPLPSAKQVVGAGTPSSPVRGAQPASPVKSILRACADSPRKAPKKKSKTKTKDAAKKEKTFSKTYVRAETFDGEHRVYSWAKPDWTQDSKLKSTGLGDRLRSGGDLANPITFPKKKPANADLQDEEDEYESVNKEELIRRLRTGNGFLKSQRKLKVTVRGANIREGGDLVKPVTMATTTKKEFHFQKPSWTEKKLNSTESGKVVKAGGDMQAPVTMATSQKKYTWEKPSWATKKVLKGDKSVGSADDKKAYTWEKPSWAKEKVLGTTSNRKKIEDGSDIVKPITFPEGKGTGINTEVRPGEVLKSTVLGEQARQGEKLESPITDLPEIAKDAGVADVATDAVAE